MASADTVDAAFTGLTLAAAFSLASFYDRRNDDGARDAAYVCVECGHDLGAPLTRANKIGQVTLTRCNIYQSVADMGGGIALSGGTTTLNECEIFDNQAAECSPTAGSCTGYGGGGLWMAQEYLDTTLHVSNSGFSSNVAFNGAGVMILGGHATFTSTRLTDRTPTLRL